MEIESVKARKTFKPVDDLPCWEILIKDKQRTTAPLSNIEDPILRNNKINSAKRCKRWREAHPEQAKASVKKWKSKPENKAKIQAADKEWRKNNPDRVKVYQERNKKNVKAWAEAHPERIRELGRKNDEKRRKSPKRKAWQAEYNQRAEVKEKHREYDRERNKSPERREKFKIYGARKRAKKKGAALFALLCNIPIIQEVA